jgi:hypothetical protein
MAAQSADRTESSEDLAYGGIVIIVARWVLVAAGLGLALWNPTGLLELQVAIVAILSLAVGNFALHMQTLTRGPLLPWVVRAASAADLGAISLLLYAGGSDPEVPYVFYLPALLAIAVTFRTEFTAGYTAAAIAAYASITLVIAPDTEPIALLTHLLMLAAVATCGNVYWRLERDRRRGPAAVLQTERVDVAPATAG